MIKIIVSGCNGKMGHVVTACIADRADCEVVAGFDINTQSSSFPVFANPQNCQIDSDVIIDFSHPDALCDVLDYAVQNDVSIVLATTGISDEQQNLIKSASEKVAVFSSGNMSLGISLLMELARKATAVLGSDFDIEIVEKHHNQKIDAPSGTAYMLADTVAKAAPYDAEYMYDRHAVREKRKKNEIGISSIRGGTIVGEHEVIFAGNDEIVTLSHMALSKNIFAVGAINAATFLLNQPAGLYNMADLVENS